MFYNHIDLDKVDYITDVGNFDKIDIYGTSRASISGGNISKVSISKVSISETSGINKQKRIDFLFFFF